MRIRNFAFGILFVLLVLTGCEDYDENLDSTFDYSEYATTDFAPDPDEWVIESGENFSFSYTLDYKESIGNKVELRVAITTPSGDPVARRSVMLPGGGAGTHVEDTFVIPDQLDPGIYIMRAFLGTTRIREVYVCVGLEEIRIEQDARPDFDSFWARSLAELDALPPDYEIEQIEGPASGFEYYLVHYKGVPDAFCQDVDLVFYYVKPEGEEKFPVIISFQGYDHGTGDPTEPVVPDWRKTNLCYISAAPRAQHFNRYFFSNPYPRYFVGCGLASPEEYYYRGAYLDAARTVEIASRLPGVDADHIRVMGGSQGGALALAAAALRPEMVDGVNPSFPFMCHFPLYLSTAQWPANDLEVCMARDGVSRSESLQTLSYFDLKNLVSRVKAPVLLQMTLQDGTCPAWTQASLISNLGGSASFHVTLYPTLGHIGSTAMAAETNAFIASPY